MQINLLVIRTHNSKALSDFYKQLGIEFDHHRHGTGPWHYSAEIGTIVFEIYPLMKKNFPDC